MPRPRKCRRVCSMPKYNKFTQTQAGGAGKEVVLTVDEYETIRLIDKENFSQEECSTYMNVARTTVQLIYAEARKKIAEALANDTQTSFLFSSKGIAIFKPDSSFFFSSRL